jgi:hypothetical protein
MSAPDYTGGCACGGLRYRMRSEPVAQTHCQCRDCQRRSGTGHSSWLVFAGGAEGDTAVKGPVSHWLTHGESGAAKRHGFCPTCGTPVTLDFPAMPGILAVTAASLDDPARFAPRMVTWTCTAQSWDVLPDGLQAHAKMPAA